MTESADVTSRVEFGNSDDESLPLTKCVCGAKFQLWHEIVSIYPEHPWVCPVCGANLYFRADMRVFQLHETAAS
jgi:hypothetical protein